MSRTPFSNSQNSPKWLVTRTDRLLATRLKPFTGVIQAGTASGAQVKRENDDRSKQDKGKNPKSKNDSSRPVPLVMSARQQLRLDATATQHKILVINAYKLRLKYANPEDRSGLLASMNSELAYLTAPVATLLL